MKFHATLVTKLVLLSMTLVTFCAFAAYHSHREDLKYDVNGNVVGYTIFTCGMNYENRQWGQVAYTETVFSERCSPEGSSGGGVAICVYESPTQSYLEACLGVL